MTQELLHLKRFAVQGVNFAVYGDRHDDAFLNALRLDAYTVNKIILKK